MTEHESGPEGHPEAETAPPAPPPPPPPSGELLTLESETPVRSGGIGGRVVAAAIGGLLLVGGVGFAAAQMGGDEGTPEGAVAELFEAIADEDVLGMLATLDPGERDTLTAPVEDFFAELERLEVLDDSFELTGIKGVDLEFQDLTFRTEPVRDDLVRVYLTGGTASYDVNTGELPVGDFLADTFERFGVEYDGIQESDSDTLTPDEAGDTFVAVRKGGDGWRISIGYTAAEAARIDAGKPVPAAGGGLAPVGADSPEAAVDGFLRAAADLDVPGLVARLSPAEFAALQDYWPIFVDQADLPSAEALGVDIELTELELRSDADGDWAQVFIDSFGIDVVAEDFSGGGTIADGCITLRGDALEAAEEGMAELDLPGPTDGQLCQADLEDLYEEAMESMGGFAMGPGMGGIDPFNQLGGETATIGITTTRIDGAWYVAPIRTWADLGIAVLETVDREDLDAMVDGIEELFGSAFFGGGMVGGGFVPPGLGGDVIEEFDAIGEELEVEPDFEVEPGLEGSSNDGSFLPRPGKSSEEMAVRADALIGELVRGAVGGDEAAASCVLDQLHAIAATEQLYELADAHELGFEPSMDTQDVFFAALQTCGAG